MTRRTDTRPRPPDRDADGRSPLERHLAPFFQDVSLWPVLCVGVMVFVTLGTSALLLAFAERNGFALAAVLLMLWISVDVVIRERRRGRFGLASRCLAGYWLLITASAFAVARAGWF